MADKKKVTSNNSPLSKEDLLKYLKKTHPEDPLSPNLEQSAEKDDFIRDALEGLQAFKSTNSIHNNVHKINNSLHQNLQKNKRKKPFKYSQIMVYITAVIIVIMLILLAFAVLRLKK